MRIGILTYHFVPNFGANLQTLSTLEYLKKHGHSPIVINWQPKSVIEQYKDRVPEIQRNKHREFLESHFPMTGICRSDNKLISEIKRNQIEAIIVGSDVVMRYSLWKNQIRLFKGRMPFRWIKRASDVIFPNPFWLNFLTKDPELCNLPTALMSVSSMGSNFIEIPLGIKKKMYTQLKRFKYISVRDSWTREMIRTISQDNIIPPITPDPVFGFNQNIKNNCTRDYILNKYNLPEKYLVISFRSKYVDKEWVKDLEKLLKKASYSCVELAVPEGTLGFQIKHKIDIPISPLDWYNIIRYSSGYIGQNMHPIVICLHNCVPFYSFDDYGKVSYLNNDVISSKIYDLLLRTSFTENCLNISFDHLNLIEPRKLLSIITKFDYEKCKNVRIKLQKEYDDMMDKMLESLEMSN